MKFSKSLGPWSLILFSIVAGMVLSPSYLFARGTSDGSGDNSDGLQPLTIGLMPAVDTAPLFYASKMGYFQELGLDVELVLFNSALDRQSALQTDQVDGALTDLVALILNRSNGFPLVGTTLTDGVFAVLSANPDGLQGDSSFGVMEVSVTNYLLDHYLNEQLTLDTQDVEKTYINAIPLRLEALLAGNLDAAVFPEPFASIAQLRGLAKSIISAPQAITPDLMAFTRKAVDSKTAEIYLFHQAYDRAVAELRESRDRAVQIIMESIPNLPSDAAALIQIPEYQESRLPSSSYLEAIVTWMATTTGQELEGTVEELFDRRFVSANR